MCLNCIVTPRTLLFRSLRALAISKIVKRIIVFTYKLRQNGKRPSKFHCLLRAINKIYEVITYYVSEWKQIVVLFLLTLGN